MDKIVYTLMTDGGSYEKNYLKRMLNYYLRNKGSFSFNFLPHSTSKDVYTITFAYIHGASEGTYGYGFYDVEMLIDIMNKDGQHYYDTLIFDSDGKNTLDNDVELFWNEYINRLNVENKFPKGDVD